MKAKDLNRAMEYIDDKYLALAEKPNKECQKMSKKKVFRLILVAAVIAMLSATAYATNFFLGYSLTSSGSRVFESYSDMKKVRKLSGLKIDPPEEFSNGYTFQDADVSTVEATDDNGKRAFTYADVSLCYRNGTGGEVYISASAQREELQPDPRPAAEVRAIGSATVTCYRDNYLLVPGDYQLSAEEEAWGNIPGNYISYGSNQVEHNTVTFLRWNQNGIIYIIMDLSGAEDTNALFAIAEELINR